MWILKKKVLLSVLLLTITCLALSGCASEEAKQVMEDIDSLGEITLDSDDDSVAVNEEYNDLTKEDK